MTGATSADSILIVGADEMAVNVLCGVLSQDFEVVVARTGAAAIALVCNGRAPALVLVDLTLPDIDGFEVASRLRAVAPGADLPVIIVASEARPELEERSFELGAIDFITKSICPQVLRARVRAHLRASHRTSVLEDLIGRDPLTQIANRRRFDEMLNQEWRRCAREQMPLSIAFSDVDYFKRYNDAFGHVAGDECLRRIATTLSDCVGRAPDLVARYGGEEFAALLPGTDRSGAGAIARRFRAQVAALRIPHPYGVHGGVVTLSVGVATTIPPVEVPASALMRAADRLLYVAKQCGRNRVAHGDLRPEDPPTAKVNDHNQRSGLRWLSKGALVSVVAGSAR